MGSGTGSMYLKDVVGPDVKGKMQKWYHVPQVEVEQTSVSARRIRRMKLKTAVFMLLDIALLTVTVLALAVKYKSWKYQCHKRFGLWLESITITGGISIITNWSVYFLLNKIKRAKIAFEEGQDGKCLLASHRYRHFNDTKCFICCAEVR